MLDPYFGGKMKYLSFLFFILIPLISFANESHPQIHDFLSKPAEKKIYIEPIQIGFSNNKIYVNFEGHWQTVDAIYSDNSGIYIKPPYFNYPWKCRLCGVSNEFWRQTCKTTDCESKRPPKYTIPKPPSPPLLPFSPEIKLPLN